MNYVWAFVVGGALCVLGQLLIDLTKLTPARILVAFVVSGVVLSALGLYEPLAEFAGAGATVPLLGFGHLLAQGVLDAAFSLRSDGLLYTPLYLGDLSLGYACYQLKGCDLAAALEQLNALLALPPA